MYVCAIQSARSQKQSPLRRRRMRPLIASQFVLLLFLHLSCTIHPSALIARCRPELIRLGSGHQDSEHGLEVERSSTAWLAVRDPSRAHIGSRIYALTSHTGTKMLWCRDAAPIDRLNRAPNAMRLNPALVPKAHARTYST